uniref:Uncharacterized protein n=1 Tax=Arundo donax TaxID=35708 RepID=A0A0A9FV87_ARUDO
MSRMPFSPAITHAAEPSGSRGGAEAAAGDAAGKEKAEAVGGRGGEEGKGARGVGASGHLHG